MVRDARKSALLTMRTEYEKTRSRRWPRGLQVCRNAAGSYGFFHTPQARGFSSGHDS
jgi:hypothetical protein